MLTIADHTFSSRLFTGTGKFARPELMAAARKPLERMLELSKSIASTAIAKITVNTTTCNTVLVAAASKNDDGTA